MPSILTRKYNTFLAEQFLAELSDARFAAYLFLSHPQEWVDSSNNAINDANPPTPTNDTQAVDFGYWKDMIGAKRLASANTAPVVARRDWVTGTVYDQYDDQATDLHTLEFYVLDTQELPYRVYKCLWNNNGGVSNVAPSTIGAAINPQSTLDGYVWQYLYTIPADDHKFLTASWMPVRSNTDVIENATTYAGRLPTAVPLLITSGGAGYNASVNASVTLIGDGSGAAVLPEGITITGGEVSQIVLSAGGSGYTEVTSINVYQSGASAQAAARAIIPPYPNHGADPIGELFASQLMSIVTFAGDEGGKLTVVNNFRRTGLVVNPIDANTSAVANGSFYRQTWDVGFSANTGLFSADDIVENITKNTAPTGVVVDVVNNTVRLTSVNVAGEAIPFEVGDTIKCNSSGVEATVASLSEPELQQYSGQIVYINHRTPVTRDTTQTETIKLVIPFG